MSRRRLAVLGVATLQQRAVDNCQKLATWADGADPPAPCHTALMRAGDTSSAVLVRYDQKRLVEPSIAARGFVGVVLPQLPPVHGCGVRKRERCARRRALSPGRWVVPLRALAAAPAVLAVQPVVVRMIGGRLLSLGRAGGTSTVERSQPARQPGRQPRRPAESSGESFTSAA